MEAVPRLHMLWFALKSSPEGTSFASLKKYIAEFYQEDPESYSKEVFALETLRNQAMHPVKDGCAVMKRYYCQLHSLQNRFPQLAERGIFTFSWKDLYQSNVNEVTDMRFEMAAVLFNIAASHTQVGASVTRGDVDGMKLACTHFQCAAWTFGELRERYENVNSGGDFMTTELLVFMQQVSYAQAQECILEKSLIDNRKPNIVAKVTAQIVVYYGAALAALLTGGDEGPIAQVIDSSVYKLWKKYVRFKISYLNCILYLYQGQHSEEQQKMGERVTLYQAAWDKLEEARKESKGLPDQKEINESLIFTADVVEAKRKNAKNENEFIYHEAVPELSTIGAVQGANLVNGISFSVTDPEVAGIDIFARLVPMKAHEASSMYSEEKAKLLRKYGGLIEERDAELASFMSSLTLDNLNINEEKANKIPQGIVDRCAALNANKTAIPDLITAMSQLADICTDVELNLNEIASILAEEERQEQEFQTLTGVKRTPNAHITELTREYQKYLEAHTRAGESNDTLRKAMELHVNNLKILARPLQEIQQSVPKLSTELNTAEIFKDVKLIVNKVNEMKAQRAQFHADLRIAVNADDITSKVIAHGSDSGLQCLFERELAKHLRLTQLLDQNLVAQQNILQALTESYAKAAPVLKTLADVKHKRETFFSSLAASYDVYEDLLAKSAKGLEFYKKLSGNVQKLLTRFKSARDVQSEERQQHLKSVSQTAAKDNYNPTIPQLPAATIATSNTPKLRDYLKSKQTTAANVAKAGFGDMNSALSGNSVAAHLPPVRPNPLGSENPTQAACGSGYYSSAISGGAPAVAPNEPPPPYTLQQTSYYEANAMGFANPMWQPQQQHIAPPAYTLQASPNSQFSNLPTQMSNLTLQNNYNNVVANQQQQQLQAAGAQQPQQQQQQVNNVNNVNTYNQNESQQLQQAANFAYNTSNQSVVGNNFVAANPYMPEANNYAAAINQASAGANFYPTAVANNINMLPTPNANNMPQPLQNANNMQQPLQNTGSMLPIPNVAPTMQQQSNVAALGTQQSTLYPTATSLQPQYQQQYIQPTPTTTYISTATANVPTTQPLYVATDINHSYNAQVPPTLQAPFVVNPLQQPQPQQQQPQQLQQQPPTQQVSSVAPTVATNAIPHATSMSATFTPYSDTMSTGNHPGYSYNSQTGQYEYGSGYQASAGNPQFYGQYTSASAFQIDGAAGTTDSEMAHKINLATGFDSPVVSHTKSAAMITAEKKEKETVAETKPNDDSYYTPPYGYHTHNTAPCNAANQGTPMRPATFEMQPSQDQQQQQLLQQQQQQQQQQALQQQHADYYERQKQQATYMQSGSVSHANTQTTKSAAPYASSAQQQQPTPTTAAPAIHQAAANAAATPPQSATPKPTVKKFSNVDLLTDIDFSGAVLNVPPPILPAPVLKPEVIASPPASEVAATTTPKTMPEEQQKPTKSTEAVAPTTPPPTPLLPAAAPKQLNSPLYSPSARKASFDNLSIGSDLSSLDNAFDWDSASVGNEKLSTNSANDKHSNTFLLTPSDPFADDKTLKYFHKEVERYEKTVESLNVKMLNGHTQLSAKWKELQDLLAKESSKRTTSIAKLFPEKNRSLDCIPYDHARVKLEKNTDDYINAAYVRNLGPGCPNFIIAQTPQQNTINDFWSMLWSQKARTVVCLHTPNEMLDPYWPQELNTEAHFDDFSVKCVKVVSLSHSTEYNLKLSMHGADPIIDLSVLQIKAWTKSLPSQVLGIARNALQGHQQRCLAFNTPNTPLIINCLTGSERSEVVAIAICAMLATQTKRPVLINVVDVWYRICSQRQQALRDTATLEHSMQIVLNHAHDVLNKRGIMTSYQMKIAPQVASKEKEEIKDPLNELDPLWKLK